MPPLHAALAEPLVQESSQHRGLFDKKALGSLAFLIVGLLGCGLLWSPVGEEPGRYSAGSAEPRLRGLLPAVTELDAGLAFDFKDVARHVAGIVRSVKDSVGSTDDKIQSERQHAKEDLHGIKADFQDARQQVSGDLESFFRNLSNAVRDKEPVVQHMAHQVAGQIRGTWANISKMTNIDEKKRDFEAKAQHVEGEIVSDFHNVSKAEGDLNEMAQRTAGEMRSMGSGLKNAAQQVIREMRQVPGRNSSKATGMADHNGAARTLRQSHQGLTDSKERSFENAARHLRGDMQNVITNISNAERRVNGIWAKNSEASHEPAAYLGADAFF